MKKGYAHIHVILDRTGSMQSIRDDVIGGFNNYIEQQKHGPGVATLSLIQFDSQDPYEVVHDFMLLAAVPPLTAKTYVPRANTPLLDALGHGIADLQGRLGKLAEAERREHLLGPASGSGALVRSSGQHRNEIGCAGPRAQARSDAPGSR